MRKCSGQDVIRIMRGRERRQSALVADFECGGKPNSRMRRECNNRKEILNFEEDWTLLYQLRVWILDIVPQIQPFVKLTAHVLLNSCTKIVSMLCSE